MINFEGWIPDRIRIGNDPYQLVLINPKPCWFATCRCLQVYFPGSYTTRLLFAGGQVGNEHGMWRKKRDLMWSRFPSEMVNAIHMFTLWMFRTRLLVKDVVRIINRMVFASKDNVIWKSIWPCHFRTIETSLNQRAYCKTKEDMKVDRIDINRGGV